MNVWNILHGNIDKNLFRLLDAQAQAEERGDKIFHCPVCGGEARWIRSFVSKRMLAAANAAGCI